MKHSPAAESPVVIVEEHLSFTLEELGTVCACDVQALVCLVEHDVLAPQGESPGDAPSAWRFGGAALPRARRALRLAQALDLDAPALALVMDLLDEIERLRAQLAASHGASTG